MSLELNMVFSYKSTIVRPSKYLHRDYDVGLVPEHFHHWIQDNMLWQSHIQDVPVIGRITKIMSITAEVMNLLVDG